MTLRKLFFVYMTLSTIMIAYATPLVIADTKQKIIQQAHEWEEALLREQQGNHSDQVAEAVGYTPDQYAFIRTKLVLPGVEGINK